MFGKSQSQGFVEFSNELHSVDDLANETGHSVQNLMQQAKDDGVGYIRLVGNDEFQGRMTAKLIKAISGN